MDRREDYKSRRKTIWTHQIVIKHNLPAKRHSTLMNRPVHIVVLYGQIVQFVSSGYLQFNPLW